MELKVLKEEKNILELEIKGEDHTLANLLRGELWNTDGVELASYNLKHPIVSSPILSLHIVSFDLVFSIACSFVNDVP